MRHYKKVVLDTNVLLYDPDVLKEIHNTEIIIPIVVLDELDNKKEKHSEIGRNARKVIRELDELRTKGSLHEGVDCGNGSRVRIEIDIHPEKIPAGLTDKKVDNQIIAVALMENHERNSTVVISKDLNVRVKCAAVGIEAEDYRKSDVDDIADVYTGAKTIEADSAVVDKFYENGHIPSGDLLPNQFALLKSGKQSALGVCKKNEIKPVVEYKKIYNIQPRNKEQLFALNLLLDPNVNLVSLTGIAGSGKTLVSLAAGLYQVLNNKDYARLVLSKPNQPMGGKDRDLGYLPGNISEKMEPWIAPFKDNLEFICGLDEYDRHVNDGIITIEALTYIRGRSIPNSFIIIDECQNLMPKEIKAIVTRVGFGSKIVLLGDISQIDNIFLDFATNGLTAVVESFKGNPIYGHVTLTKGERSELATLASQLL